MEAKETLKLRQIYFVEEVELEEPDIDEGTYEYEYNPHQELVATGVTIIRIYDLIGGQIKKIETIFASTDMDSTEIVEVYLKGLYKFVKKL